MTGFTAVDISDQTGKTIFITGANTGLGFEVAKALAGKNARVIIGCRSEAKANQAKSDIEAEYKNANVDVVALDLSDLASIKAAAEKIQQEERLDVLINNAGIMVPPYELTKDGFESQFGVNHLGPFALTNLLLDKLNETPNSRIVSTASIAHKQGKIDFADINAEKKYSAVKRYAMSKLANLYFGYELQRRLTKAKYQTISVVAHPGVADTELIRYLPKFLTFTMPVVKHLFNSAEQGAWPTLCAATQADVQGGEYYGPNGWREISGPAIKVESTRLSHDEAIAKRLWDLSVEMTGVNSNI
jgi:NAD(P)-dependent dehydrogenase (short-subunit alcohol dehydrogenase family)